MNAHKLLLFGLIILSSNIFCQTPVDIQSFASAKGDRIINIMEFFDLKSATSGFQEAVESLKKSGGTIFVPPGQYKIRRSIVLYSNIYIVGSGENSVILRMDSCMQRSLAKNGKTGDTVIEVEDVTGFHKGGEVTIASNSARYWDCTNAEILNISGNKITLNRPLKKDYSVGDQAVVMNFFSVFAATKAENIHIENLTINGKMEPDGNFGCHFVCSALHFNDVSNASIDKVTVKQFPSDGFSIQRGSNVSVTNCIAEYNLGNGFHPGTTLTASSWIHNIGRHNGLDGLFFCFNVTYSTFSDNRFYGNKKNGIGDLGEGGQTGDQMNVISGNYCYENFRSGIECTPGGNNVIVNNVCENNSMEESGKWPAISLRDTYLSLIQGNRCSDKPITNVGKLHAGILLKGKCENNVISGNILTGFSGGIEGDNLEMNTIFQNVLSPYKKVIKSGK